MYELIQVSGGSYYVQSPAKAGLVRLNDTDVCLIDSGSDKDAGRKIRQILDKNGWHLTAICNTHSHADRREPVPPEPDGLPRVRARGGVRRDTSSGA